MDGIALREKPLKPHEWRFELQKWAFGAFKTRSLRVGTFKARSLTGFSLQTFTEMPCVHRAQEQGAYKGCI